MTVLALLLCAALLPLATPAAAQTWPERTVRFLVPLGAGSGADIGARLLAERSCHEACAACNGQTIDKSPCRQRSQSLQTLAPTLAQFQAP